MKYENSEKILQYLKGLLNEVETKAFNDRIIKDKKFARQVALHQAVYKRLAEKFDDSIFNDTPEMDENLIQEMEESKNRLSQFVDELLASKENTISKEAEPIKTKAQEKLPLILLAAGIVLLLIYSLFVYCNKTEIIDKESIAPNLDTFSVALHIPRADTQTSAGYWFGGFNNSIIGGHYYTKKEKLAIDSNFVFRENKVGLDTIVIIKSPTDIKSSTKPNDTKKEKLVIDSTFVARENTDDSPVDTLTGKREEFATASRVKEDTDNSLVDTITGKKEKLAIDYNLVAREDTNSSVTATVIGKDEKLFCLEAITQDAKEEMGKESYDICSSTRSASSSNIAIRAICESLPENLDKLSNEEVISVLESKMDAVKLTKNAFFIHDFSLLLSIRYFEAKNMKKAIQTIKLITEHDAAKENEPDIYHKSCYYLSIFYIATKNYSMAVKVLQNPKLLDHEVFGVKAKSILDCID